jgi:predicted ABC-type ATPase
MPDLIIIAGCNGAGKSTFASSFLPEGLTSFDYDRVFFTLLIIKQLT